MFGLSNRFDYLLSIEYSFRVCILVDAIGTLSTIRPFNCNIFAYIVNHSMVESDSRETRAALLSFELFPFSLD